MRPRDAAAARDAVGVLLSKSASAEMHRCASATLAALGVDEFTALARARDARRSVPGLLRKDVGTAPSQYGITVRAPMGNGSTLALEMTPAEAVSLAAAVQDAITGRSVR